MPFLIVACLIGFGGLAPSATACQNDESGLVVRAVRFYRPQDHQTRVKGLIQIPLSAMAPSGGPSGPSSYSVAVRVADSTGLTLYQQSWRNRVTVGSTAANAYTVEIVDFAVVGGEYELEVGIEDSLSGRKLQSTVRIKALSDSTTASDLLLAPDMRLAETRDTVPRAGEFRTGNDLVTAAAQVRLTPLRPKVYYLLEAYADQGASGTMAVSVARPDGSIVTRTAAVPIKVAAGGSMLRGQLDLTGLPPGTYTLAAELKMGGRTVHRSATLTMAGLGETLASDTARRAATRVTDEGYFGEMTPTQLEAAKAPLMYVANQGELSVWGSKLSVAAKRRFLADFWRQRDPTPGTPRNERRESFYSAVAFANTAFREGGRRPQAGWRSDRGRIYAQYGTPEQTLRRQQEGRAPPYEVWSYSTGKGAYFIFADRSGFSAYTLIATNDIREPSLPGWGELLGAPAVDDIGRFLGIDLIALVKQQN